MHREIPLKKGVAAWVDDEDFEQFGGVKWRLHSSGYACRDGKPFTGREGIVLLHRLVVGAHAGQVVRPRNNVKLDCRRANLVVAAKQPRRNQDEENLTAIVLRFVRAFPAERKFGLPCLRKQLQEAWHMSGLTVEKMLQRIDGWAAARAHIAPWDLADPAPVLFVPQADPVAPVALPPASPVQTAILRARTAEWRPDGSE